MTGLASGEPRIVTIGGYLFEGPFDSPRELEDRAGIFAVLDVSGSGCRVIDVGESPAVRSRMIDHDRNSCWARASRGTLKVAVHYTDLAKRPWRRQMMKELRALFVPPCREVS